MYKNALKEDLIRVVENLEGTVESTDTIVKLKTKIENSSTFESDPDFVKTLIQNCIDERVSRYEREVTLEKQKIELAKLQLTKLEKEVELQTAKNKALSLNPAAKVEEKQFETNIENMITSIKTLSLPVPTRSENFNLFFQSLERAFLIKKINDEYKSEILINLLGERAHNVLLYIKEEELNDYEKLKSIVLREFQLTPRECLNSFKNAVKSSGETYIQFAARLTANFQYIMETATHIGIREAEDWFRPIDLAKECDIYISSRGGSPKETPITLMDIPKTPLRIDHKTLNQRLKRTIPNILKEKIKIALYAVIHLIAQETRMVEVKPINISLDQHSPSLSVRTAISPTLTEEFIIHPSVYAEIEKLGHAKSDVLLSESGSSLGVHFNSNVSVSSVRKNSSYDLPHVKNFNTRNDLSSLIKDYKCNNIKSTKLKLCIKLKNDIPVCQRTRRLSCSDNPSPMKSEHRRFVLLRRIFQPWQWKRRKKRNRFEQTSRTLQRKISMRSTKDQLVKKDVLMPVKQCFPVEHSGCRRGAFT
ncbi:integrase catalytic domain-containing protein [Trichonephila clavipes]|nr:integrase catalytic domain-containing protein [Trichonephila clavipes]